MKERITLSPTTWKTIREFFPAGMTPVEEREGIRLAVARLEVIVGRMTGTWRDLAGNYAGTGLGGQLDCISESLNTTTYLQLLADDGLLGWHTVEDRQVRRWLFAPHWTAVIANRMDGEHFAVDSWYLDNGHLPFIQPLEEWLKGRQFDGQ